MKSNFQKLLLLINSVYIIQIAKLKNEYFGKFSDFELKKITPNDKEIYDKMLRQPQSRAVTEAEFLGKFLLNKIKLDEFIDLMLNYQELREKLLFFLVKDMCLINEKVEEL